MKILLIIDQFDDENNGTTISAQRFATTLRKHGNEVKILTTGKKSNYKFWVPERHIPIVTKVAKKQGMCFAKPDNDILVKAVTWADVVHFLLPFKLSRKGLKVCKELKVASTAAFHLQPENITYNIKLSNVEFAAHTIYKMYKRTFYDNFNHIHCPSKFIASELKKNDYKAKLHVISNGVDSDFKYNRKKKNKEFFNILMIGRLSPEKRQDVLIEGIYKSKYKDKIKLYLAGKGPYEEKLKKLSSKLPNKTTFGFYSKKELINLMGNMDLYVHAADVEIEAISCIEAFSSGLVPIISNSSKSATPQFALDDRSLFIAGDSDDLAKKIDYWIENDEEKYKMEYKYAEYGKEFAIDACVYKIEEMFKEAIEDKKYEYGTK